MEREGRRQEGQEESQRQKEKRGGVKKRAITQRRRISGNCVKQYISASTYKWQKTSEKTNESKGVLSEKHRATKGVKSVINIFLPLPARVCPKQGTAS